MKGYDTLAVSGTRSASFSSDDIDANLYRGAKVVVSIGSITSGGLTATIEGKDRVSQKYYTILASAPLLTSQDKVLTVYPGITATTNVSASDVLPDTWRVSITVASGTASYSIGASYIE